MKYWYVHDEADCFDRFETVEAAGLLAKFLVSIDTNGVHITYMTEAQAAVYTQTGDLRTALKSK